MLVLLYQQLNKQEGNYNLPQNSLSFFQEFLTLMNSYNHIWIGIVQSTANYIAPIYTILGEYFFILIE